MSKPAIDLENLMRQTKANGLPDIGLAVDLGRKAFEDALRSIATNMNLATGVVEAAIVEMTALAALHQHQRGRKKAAELIGDPMIKSMIDTVEKVFTLDEDELEKMVAEAEVKAREEMAGS